MKNIVVVIGSPRENGNTSILANAFIEGARKAGSHVEAINIIGKRINGCTGCNVCYNESHECVQKDDMTECYEVLKKADVIAFATPIYFYGVSAQLKSLIDRLHNPIRNTFQVRKLVLLSVCADTIPTVFESVKSMYHSVLAYFGLEDGGMITVLGVKDKGDITGNAALKEAEELGERI